MTVTVGGTSTSIAVRRVLPTRDHETGTDTVAAPFRSVRHWLQGRPDRGVAAEWPVGTVSAVRGEVHPAHRAGPSGETVWGNVCGCACG